MKVCIIGAGLTGLSTAVDLVNQGGYDIHIFEASSNIGGIAHVRNVDGRAFHTCGGHCFNTRDPEVISFIQRNDLEEVTNGNLRNREAVISFTDGMEIPYPIELNLRTMFQQKPILATEVLVSLLRQRLQPRRQPKNLQDFFIQTFGERMANLYFLPYNTKVWGRNPRDLTADWIGGKLPQAPLKDIISSIFGKRTDKMIHQKFYYPTYKGGGHYLADALLDKCFDHISLHMETPVEAIQPRKSGVEINGELFDAVISTAPLSKLLSFVQDINIDPEAKNLFPVNGLTTVLREGAPKDRTWTYLPSSNVRSHRLIHLSNFYECPQKFSTQEAHGKVDASTMEKDILPNYMNARILDYSYTQNAYPVFIDKTNATRDFVLRELEEYRIISAGRFGSHSYVNMDGAIAEGMRAAKRLSTWRLS